MKSILVVDDSPAILALVNLSLTKAGFNVSGELSGSAALNAVQKNLFDLFVVDINMPGMDGFTLIRKLRELPDYTKTPILVLTAEEVGIERQQGKEAGASGWLVKPFQPATLLAVVNKLLKDKD
jgi:two-component system, chemotaxis family, chemotaxis protein CheY